MFSKGIIDRIEDLHLSTASRLAEMQKCTCPMISVDIELTEQFEYWYDGYLYTLWEDDTRLFAVKNLPFCYDNELRNNVFEGDLLDLVNDDKIFPFLLFIDGTPCRWSDIHIIRDTDYSYIKIRNTKYHVNSHVNLLYIPMPSKKIRYGEDNDYLTRLPIRGLYFNKDRKLLKSPAFENISLRLEFLDDNIIFDIVRYTKVNDNTYHISSLNSKFEKDISFLNRNYNSVILPLFDTNDIKLTMDNVFIYDNITQRINPDTRIISTMHNGAVANALAFNKDDSEDSKVDLYLVIAVNKKVNAYASNLSAIEANSYTRHGVAKLVDTLTDSNDDMLYGNVTPALINNFNFKFDRNLTYQDNVKNAAEYITKYNYALWNKAFIKDSNIKSYTYSGTKFLSLADKDGFVNYSRKHSDLIEDKIMMFVNSYLYQYSMDIVYKNNTILIPTFGIEPDDDIEILLFTKCNNTIADITFANNRDMQYMHPEYDFKDCYIMSDVEPTDHAYRVPESDEGRRQYICDIIDIESSTDNSGKISVNFYDDVYYGKPLKLVPKNQFRYYRFKKQPGLFKLILPVQFNYCHDRDRYMVFINGRKIDKTMYTITIMNKYRPFDKLVLYLSTILDEDDYVDVFYLPEELRETYLEKETSNSGVIRLARPNNYPKLHALSKYTNMIFVNGRKINPRNLYDISMTDIGILYREDKLYEKYNVCIVEYLNIEDTLYKYLLGTHSISRNIVGVDAENNEHAIEGIGPDNNKYKISGDEELKLNKTLLYDTWNQALNYFQNADIVGNDKTFTSLEDAMDKQLSNIFQMQHFDQTPPASINENFAGLRAVLYDVVLDYYFTRSDATTGEPFVYDFEAQEFDNPYALTDEMHDLPDGFSYFTKDSTDTLLVDKQKKTDLYIVEVYDDEEGQYKKLIPIFPDKDKLYDYRIIDKVATPELVRKGKLFRKLN
nr:MAG TPA: hypothetical protein [Caudoviricetes sp.]